MKTHRIASIVIAASLLVGTALTASNVWAQAQGLTANLLLRTTLSGDDSREAAIITAEFAPGGTTGRHTHPGDEYTVVLLGTLELHIDGREPRQVSVGDAYHTTKGVIHETRNVGDGPARVSITFVIDKGKPITQPAQ